MIWVLISLGGGICYASESMWLSTQGSVHESIIAAKLDGKYYEDTIRLAVSLGGDSDT